MFPASSMEHFSAHPPPDPKYSARFRRRYTGANYHQPDPGTQGLEVLTATGESVISLEGGHYLTRGERFARRIGQYYARGDFGQRKTLATSTQTWKLPPVPAAKIPQAVSFYVNVAGLHVAVKKYLYIPADLVRRFPSIGSSQEIVGRGVEKRIYLSHYQIIRLLKAISKVNLPTTIALPAAFTPNGCIPSGTQTRLLCLLSLFSTRELPMRSS
ncbi:uncharacterized protein LOC129597802 [Paramacrobiotus metropolitanus]|uniref:uncharacterized protein LOC129597802 n=1 Tax=Paramacrobiotus metropolitanus TaxID=2943436 RepID=UPI0024459CE5|nr:uncharacterized protein LOC129597802 [Paramacrobiotus metropolitanus]